MPSSTPATEDAPVLVTASRRLWRSLRYVAHVDSWLTIGVLALIIGALEQLAAAPLPNAAVAAPAAQLLWAAYFYFVARKASTGARRLPRLRDYRDSWERLWRPLGQGALATFWYWAPLTLVVAFTVGFADFATRLQGSPLSLLQERPTLLLAALSTQLLYLPASLWASLGGARPLRLLDPSLALRAALRLGRPYGEAFMALCALVLMGVVVASAAAALEQALPIPLVAPTIGQTLQLWVPLAQARVLGELAKEHPFVTPAVA